ncbi:DUF2784 domain-containing protein [Actinokineospora iranica]|uniref:DUF2784 domain-containing protein n=1 Tax=Actinokineospora iranica TaxID=1271860 RepID=A0A1G6Q4H6_9PSEU|nr:DUF2784 domain-containing protein [Actinokineospora iranica]SDC87198.1 Protein of Unknown function [Actinokineospora iranica]
MAAVLATATTIVHFVALLYIGLGGFLAWKWPKTVFVHVFFAAWGVVVNVTSVPCPLTTLENHFRHQQGLGDLPGGFNEHYIIGVLFPEGYIHVVALFALALLIVSYVGAYLLWRKRLMDVMVPAQ